MTCFALHLERNPQIRDRVRKHAERIDMHYDGFDTDEELFASIARESPDVVIVANYLGTDERTGTEVIHEIGRRGLVPAPGCVYIVLATAYGETDMIEPGAAAAAVKEFGADMLWVDHLPDLFTTLNTIASKQDFGLGGI